jgi:hypothetical protein
MPRPGDRLGYIFVTVDATAAGQFLVADDISAIVIV